MAAKDLSDALVCRAYREARKQWHYPKWPYEFLEEWTGQPRKVCIRAMERTERHGLIEAGVSLRSAWLTEAGKNLLKESEPENPGGQS